MRDEELDDAEAWLDRTVDELLRLDAARPEEIRGCTDAEVREVLAECVFGSPPLTYVEFMRKCGRGAGNLFRGSDLYYPECLGLREYAEEAGREENESVPIGDRFFFAHHQGYILYYFLPGDERVWCYTLGGTGEKVVAASFPVFVADHVAIPERSWKRFRDMDEKNRRS